MLRKDVKIAWNLLHLLDDEYQKVLVYHHALQTTFKMEVGLEHLEKIITQLGRFGIVDTKKKHGVRRSATRHIYMKDVLKALGAQPTLSTFHPADRIESDAWAKLEDVTFTRRNLNDE